MRLYLPLGCAVACQHLYQCLQGCSCCIQQLLSRLVLHAGSPQGLRSRVDRRPPRLHDIHCGAFTVWMAAARPRLARTTMKLKWCQSLNFSPACSAEVHSVLIRPGRPRWLHSTISRPHSLACVCQHCITTAAQALNACRENCRSAQMSHLHSVAEANC